VRPKKTVAGLVSNVASNLNAATASHHHIQAKVKASVTANERALAASQSAARALKMQESVLANGKRAAEELHGEISKHVRVDEQFLYEGVGLEKRCSLDDLSAYIHATCVSTASKIYKADSREVRMASEIGARPEVKSLLESEAFQAHRRCEPNFSLDSGSLALYMKALYRGQEARLKMVFSFRNPPIEQQGYSIE
jgi:hypothetical protein